MIFLTASFNTFAFATDSKIETAGSTNKVKTLRANLPDYVFEFDMEKLYPSTWQFYKKLDITNRDKVYSYYLYNPSIGKVRHQIFKLALGKGKGKSLPRPVILSEILLAMKADKSNLITSSVHSITDSPAISAINFDADTHKPIYTFLQDN